METTGQTRSPLHTTGPGDTLHPLSLSLSLSWRRTLSLSLSLSLYLSISLSLSLSLFLSLSLSLSLSLPFSVAKPNLSRTAGHPSRIQQYSKALTNLLIAILFLSTKQAMRTTYSKKIETTAQALWWVVQER